MQNETMQDRIKTLESQIEWQKAGVDSGFPLTAKQAIWLPIAEELVKALKDCIKLSSGHKEIIWQSSVEDECNEIARMSLESCNLPLS